LDTGDKKLVEDSDVDMYWGGSLPGSKNVLGEMLMGIREEKRRMLNWNLTALTYMHVDDWKSLFKKIGYDRDYYWFIP
jgi:hypothetical protein